MGGSACSVSTTRNIAAAISVTLSKPSVGAHLQDCTCRLHTFSLLHTVLWTGRWCIALWLEDTRAMNAFNLCSFYGAGTEVWHFSVVVRLRYEVENVFNINIAARTCCVNICRSEVMSSLPGPRYSTGTWQCNAEHFVVLIGHIWLLQLKWFFSSQCFLFLGSS